jgi:hypothetical protein
MRILIICDSHGKKMVETIRRQGVEARMITIVKGTKIDKLRRIYRTQIGSIRRFRPDKVLLHMAHNDLVRHSRHNPHATYITGVVEILMEFTIEILSSFPHSQLYLSSPLPRLPSCDYSADSARKYNRIAKRFGEHLLTQRKALQCFEPVLNRFLWGRLSKFEARAGVFRSDGLHLNKRGREILGESWISALIG